MPEDVFTDFIKDIFEQFEIQKLYEIKCNKKSFTIRFVDRNNPFLMKTLNISRKE